MVFFVIKEGDKKKNGRIGFEVFRPLETDQIILFNQRTSIVGNPLSTDIIKIRNLGFMFKERQEADEHQQIALKPIHFYNRD